ncbi:MAG: hypothetical protein ACFHWX_18455 [Bacteroidota bacterium]
MINFFKNISKQDEATALYIDICKSLTDKIRIKEASEQFAIITSPSFQSIILQLSKIKNLQFHAKGNWIHVTGESYAERFKIANIKTGEFTRIFQESKGNWYFKPKNEMEYSMQMILKQVKNIPGVEVEIKGKYNCIWLSGKTFPVLDKIKAINTGKYKRKFSDKKQWYFYPNYKL